MRLVIFLSLNYELSYSPKIIVIPRDNNDNDCWHVFGIYKIFYSKATNKMVIQIYIENNL